MIYYHETKTGDFLSRFACIPNDPENRHYHIMYFEIARGEAKIIPYAENNENSCNLMPPTNAKRTIDWPSIAALLVIVVCFYFLLGGG